MPDNSLAPDQSVSDWPLYWFAALEKAVEQGNFDAAALAVRELRRLGVEVTYRRPPKTGGPEDVN
jgi:hypothetical protein